MKITLNIHAYKIIQIKNIMYCTNKTLYNLELLQHFNTHKYFLFQISMFT